jgi:L-ascorbate metabolism protein UlaG (beta-lactamase superfamily)
MERLTYIGHATTLLRLEEGTVLTDPILRAGVGPLRWQGKRPEPGLARLADVVLISHLHRDHLDLPSLRRIPVEVPLVAPRGTGDLIPKIGQKRLVEVAVGETIKVAGVEVMAVPAVHNGHRDRWGEQIEPLGFVIQGGGSRVYFAGDTDLFDGMSELGPIDLALLPVWGWGTQVGEGHLDPERAARALREVRPRWAVPIHWGALFPLGLRRLRPRFLIDPPRQFARLAERYAPEVEVRILSPGGETDLRRR